MHYQACCSSARACSSLYRTHAAAEAIGVDILLNEGVRSSAGGARSSGKENLQQLKGGGERLECNHAAAGGSSSDGVPPKRGTDIQHPKQRVSLMHIFDASYSIACNT